VVPGVAAAVASSAAATSAAAAAVQPVSLGFAVSSPASLARLLARILSVKPPGGACSSNSRSSSGSRGSSSSRVCQ
jgi:hypothetical protein